MKFILPFLILVSAIFISCSKEEAPVTQQNQQKVQNDENKSPGDTNLTPEEKFSSLILIDFLGDTEMREDLAEFLETEIFKMGASYNGASVVEITPSTWLVSLEKDGNIKNHLLQRYVDFKQTTIISA